jgi:hypothetical protein
VASSGGQVLIEAAHRKALSPPGVEEAGHYPLAWGSEQGALLVRVRAKPAQWIRFRAFVGDRVFDALDEGADGAAVFQDQVVEAEGLGVGLGHSGSVGSDFGDGQGWAPRRPGGCRAGCLRSPGPPPTHKKDVD